MSESIRKYKPLKEIIINWSCVIGCFFAVFYIFKDLNALACTMSFEFGFVLFFIEFIICVVLAVMVTTYVREKLGLEEERGIQVHVT